MPCDYVDNSHSCADGYWCQRTGEHVDWSFSRDYCSTSARWCKCPVLTGGSAEAEEESRQPEPEPECTAEQSSAWESYSEPRHHSHWEEPEPDYHYDYTPEPDVICDDTDSMGGSSGGGYVGSGFSFGDLFSAVGLLGKLVIYGVVGFGILYGIFYFLSVSGLMKSSLTLHTTLSDAIPAEQVTVSLVSTDGKHSVETTTFDADGNATLKVKGGTYELFLEYNGISVCYLTIDSTMTDYTIDTDMLSIFTCRPAVFTFCLEDGTVLEPDSVTVTSEGETSELSRISATQWIAIFDANQSDVPMQFSTDTYTSDLLELTCNPEGSTEFTILMHEKE